MTLLIENILDKLLIFSLPAILILCFVEYKNLSIIPKYVKNKIPHNSEKVDKK